MSRFTKPLSPGQRQRLVANAAQHLRDQIADLAAEFGVTPCDIEAELLKQSLLSDDCDRCHVHWLELYAKLEEALKQ